MCSHIVYAGHAELKVTEQAVFDSRGGEFTRVCRPAATATDMDVSINETRQECLAAKVQYTRVCRDDGSGTDCGNFRALDNDCGIFQGRPSVAIDNPATGQCQDFSGAYLAGT